MSNSGIAPTFEGLGFLPNGTSSDATAVSGDGSVAVGYATNSTGLTQAFSWFSGVMTSLGSLNPSTTVPSQAFGTNSNGSTVVGMSYYPLNGAPAYAYQAFTIFQRHYERAWFPIRIERGGKRRQWSKRQRLGCRWLEPIIQWRGHTR